MVLCWRTGTGALGKLQAMWFRLRLMGEGARSETDKCPHREDPEGHQWALALGSAGQQMGSSERMLKGGSGAV